METLFATGSSSIVPPGTCLVHGSFVGSACPTCSTGGMIPNQATFLARPWKPLQPWTLAKRWGDDRMGWRLLFRSGDDRLEVEVPEEVWRAFGK